jgi:cbb3-type cytochrome oxidase maturation protein
MDSLLWIVPLSLLLVALALWAFFWAVDAGQFEDLESPGWSVLEEDQPPTTAPNSTPAPATAMEDKAP